ncbi:class A beta-lactamase [Micromonospora cremea]|uniref:Beta-lactamase n=1 Tax=Micromonospora cremea TaxID=709881 RepID=A0A1N5WJ81_9ACTN|nr:class A beta-lactamase [Micromonospora cremea]SIM85382.1 beta-lactamase class A [Micromonospora cremea]
MTSAQPAITRRALLGAAVVVPLAGCTERDNPPAASSSASASVSPSSAPISPATASPNDHHDHLASLERKFDARLGVYALATGTGATIAHRADERFPFCSTFKGLAAAAVLHRHPLSDLSSVVRYTRDDLMESSVITRQHVARGMTLRQLSDAAVRYSDGTAGNLLLRDLGGPRELTAYVRGLGDTVTRMDRIEPAVASAIPGDPRDTTSPRALSTNYQHIVLGEALPPDKRAFLRDLLERNATSVGAQRIRAGVPRGWTVADKTGTGGYGTVNDIGVVWPPAAAPLVIGIMSSKAEKDTEHDQALIAEAAAYVVATLT